MPRRRRESMQRRHDTVHRVRDVRFTDGTTVELRKMERLAKFDADVASFNLAIPPRPRFISATDSAGYDRNASLQSQAHGAQSWWLQLTIPAAFSFDVNGHGIPLLQPP